MDLHRRVQKLFNSPHPDESGRPLLGDGEKLVVAVSGGPDSLALLHLLVDLEIVPTSKILVAHLDHGLRSSSVEDAAVVRERAERFGVRCVVSREDVRAKASSEGLTEEEAGRMSRYEFFAGLARDEEAALVATGHNADDQAETILMNLLRGSGPRGLRGMLPVSSLPGAGDIVLARPLLTTTRKEIESYCSDHGLNPIVDATNQDPAYHRNWLRLELLPVIDARAPGIKERLRQTADIITSDYDLLDGILDDTWSFLVIDCGIGWHRLDLSVWRVLPISLRRSTLRRAVSLARDDASDIGFRTIELARTVAEREQVGSQSTLPGGVSMTVGYDDLLIAGLGASAPDVDIPQLQSSARVPVEIPGTVTLSGKWVLLIQVIDSFEPDIVFGNLDPWRAYVSLPEVEELFVRPPVSGERFQPLGLDGHSTSVQDVMVNRKIPQALRSLWPVVVTSNHLVWLAGHHIDHRARVTDAEKPVVELRIERQG